MDFTNLIIYGIIAWFIYTIFFKQPSTTDNTVNSELELTLEQKEEKQLQEIKNKYPNAGWVYLIERDGYYKIGQSSLGSYKDKFATRFDGYTTITGLPVNKCVTNLIFFTATSLTGIKDGKEIPGRLEKNLHNYFENKDYHVQDNTGKEWFSKFPYRHKIKTITQENSLNNFVIEYETNLKETVFPVSDCIEMMKREYEVKNPMDTTSKQFLNQFAYKSLIDKSSTSKEGASSIFLHPAILNHLNLNF